VHAHANPPVSNRECTVVVPFALLVAGLLLFGRASDSQAKDDAAVPILMYHVVASPPPGAPFPELYVDERRFQAQLSWLGRRGFHGVTLRAVYDHWTRGTALPDKPIVLTFDDGYRSTYTNAFRMLRRHRWPGVLNLDVSNLGVSWGLSERRVRALVAAGWEVDSHSLTHPDLTSIDPVRLRREVARSREVIHRRFSVPGDFFCYPAGRFDSDVVEAVRRAGYLGATTTQFGLARPRNAFTLSRVRVNGTDTVGDLVAKLRSLGVHGV
jgi:peptidoglycan/xylan/chitin deacetylase (PgdA/CDA1 family)